MKTADDVAGFDTMEAMRDLIDQMWEDRAAKSKDPDAFRALVKLHKEVPEMRCQISAEMMKLCNDPPITKFVFESR